jgi:hypothetical protein
LPRRAKCDSGYNNAGGWGCEPNAGGKKQEYIEIYKNKKTENSYVYNARRRTVSFREINTIPRASKQLSVLAEASAVAQETDQNGGGKHYDEKCVHKNSVSVRVLLVLKVLARNGQRFGNTERFIEKRINEHAQYADGKPRFVKAVAARHFRCCGEQRGHGKACYYTEHESEHNARNAYVEQAENVFLSDSVAEKEIAYKWRERRGEHGGVKVIGKFSVRYAAVKKNAEHRGPHVKEVKPVEALRDDKKITRHNS